MDILAGVGGIVIFGFVIVALVFAIEICTGSHDTEEGESWWFYEMMDLNDEEKE